MNGGAKKPPPSGGGVVTNDGEIREFLQIIHTHITALNKPKFQDLGLLQLICVNPNIDGRVGSKFYEVGDVGRMAADASFFAGRGLNVYIGTRTIHRRVREGRGELQDTRFVFAFVVDDDADKGKTSKLQFEHSLLVESSPGNAHKWLLTNRFIGWHRAYDIGRRLRVSVANTDSCTGCVTTPFRVPGTPNYPSLKKRLRGRVITPTQLLDRTPRRWSVGEMHRAFPPLTEARQRAEGMSVIGADACMITYALAHINNNPPVDRDTWRSIVLSCNYASFLAVDTFVADTIKKTCFDWSLSSMGAIPGRYTGKSLRKMWDWASHRCQEGREAGNPVGLGTLYRIAVEKGMNMQRALAVWNEYAGKEMDEATERAELYRMTSNG